MDKFLKIVLIALAVLMVINLAMSLFGGNQNLKQAIDNINKSQQKLDSSLMQINYTRSKIDSINQDMANFKLYIQDIQGRVQILDLENRQDMVEYKKYKTSLQHQLDSLYKNMDTTSKLNRLVVTD